MVGMSSDAGARAHVDGNMERTLPAQRPKIRRKVCLDFRSMEDFSDRYTLEICDICIAIQLGQYRKAQKEVDNTISPNHYQAPFRCHVCAEAFSQSQSSCKLCNHHICDKCPPVPAVYAGESVQWNHIVERLELVSAYRPNTYRSPGSGGQHNKPSAILYKSKNKVVYECRECDPLAQYRCVNCGAIGDKNCEKSKYYARPDLNIPSRSVAFWVTPETVLDNHVAANGVPNCDIEEFGPPMVLDCEVSMEEFMSSDPIDEFGDSNDGFISTNPVNLPLYMPPNLEWDARWEDFFNIDLQS